MKLKVILLPIGFMGILLSLANAEAVNRFEYRKLVMGVEARLVLYAEEEAEALGAATAAFARLDDLDAILSDYRQDSELRRLSARSGQGPIPVSEDLFAVLQKSEWMAKKSGGAFDPTLGSLVVVWRAAREDGVLPDEKELLKARTSVGFEKIQLDAGEKTIALKGDRVALDLGGIAKGYAADQALKTLAAQGFSSALVDLGGDLVLGDPPPGKKGWTVAVGCGEEGKTLLLSRTAVATSGATEQFLIVDGVRHSHILDPRTGRAVTVPLCVSVIAADGATADALASAISVLGRRAGMALALAVDAEAIVEDERFDDLFDGQTLNGWVTEGGRYDGAAVWEVRDGCIVGKVGENRAGGLLYTERPYTAYELELDVKTDYPFDSGIFLRMAPVGKGAQVTIDDRSDGEIGGIYSDGYLEHNERGENFYRRGEWNHFRVKVTGFDMHIEVWLNDEKITGYRLPADSEGYAPTGLIGIQVHGGRDDPEDHEVRFRNLKIRELPVFAPDIEGFKPIFNGKDMQGLEVMDDPDAYRVRDGILEFLNREGGGYIRTAEDYRDFRLRLDFRIKRMANSGVFLRASRDGSSPAYSGCEVQILDDVNWEEVTETELKPWQFTGSLYGSVAPARSMLRPPGEWNTYEILYRGSRLAVALNGMTLYDVDTLTVPGKPFGERAGTGFIGFQRHASPHVEGEVALEFRNIEVENLDG